MHLVAGPAAGVAAVHEAHADVRLPHEQVCRGVEVLGHEAIARGAPRPGYSVGLKSLISGRCRPVEEDQNCIEINDVVLEGAIIEDDDVGVGAGVHLGELLPPEGQRLVVPDNRWIK